MRIDLLFLIASLTFFFAEKSSNADELLESEKELIAWLDSLGYQDLSEAPIVKVATGEWTQRADEPKQNRFKIGFLIAENETEFTIIDLSGSEITYAVKVGDVEAFESVYFDPLDIVEAAQERINSAEENEQLLRGFRTFNGMTSETFETVFFARACAAQGHDRTAHELFELSKQQVKKEGRGRFGEVIKFLKEDQANTRMWRAVLAFEDPSITRPQLLEKFQDIVDHFPESKHAERATETADLLKKMIAEDKEHVNQKVPSLDELEGDALVAELIFQLRTQNGRQWSQPGACNIFLDEREKNSPAEQLVALGLDAVPQLIEAMDDQRFTRSVGFHRNFYFSHHVLRVGDCAEQILFRIAGRGFYARDHTNGAMVKDGKAQTTKERVKAWWKEVQEKGEEQVLIEAVSSGDNDSAEQARVLIKRYPDSAVNAIRKGLSVKSAHDWVTRAMIKRLDELGTEEALNVVAEQLVEGPTSLTKIEAARVLFKNGRKTTAIEQMMREWKEYAPPKKRDPFDDPQTELAKFLLRSGSVEAVEAVTKDFTQLKTRRKFDVIFSFTRKKLSSSNDAYAKSVEAWLISCLQITDEADRHGSFGSKFFSNPRICDMAGYVLTENWPESYNCQLDGEVRERDKARFAAINHWRKANELEPIEPPKPFTADRVSAEVTDPLVEIIVSGEPIDSVENALARLGELGPGAIEAAERLSDRTDDSHPFAKDIEQLVPDLANTVTVLKFAEHRAEIDQAWQERMEAWKGKTLSSDTLITMLTDFAKDQPCPGVRLKAVRDGSGNGIELTVEWVSLPEPGGSTLKMWNVSEHVRLGGRTIRNSVGGASLQHATDAECHFDLRAFIDEALRSTEKSTRISVSLVIDR